MLKRVRMFLRTLFLLPFSAALPAAAAEFQLEFPLACDMGKTCWIQQYADHDKGPAARDYSCGGLTYDGHDGTDIRVRSTADSADVLASADGIVVGTRDGVPDHLMQSEADKNAVANRECGNGVRIEHAGGWSTQYCHMRDGSIVVKKGETVTAGQKLGRVGYSGAAAFPHLHLSVQNQKRTIDPFSGPLDAACYGTDQPLWSTAAQAKLSDAGNNLMALGFSGKEVTLPALENGEVADLQEASRESDLIAFGWLINLAPGDELSLSLKDPAGQDVASNRVQLDRRKAQYFVMAGKRKPPAGWPAGTYSALLVIANKGKVTLQQNRTIVIH